jgi:phage shock protein A
LGFANRLSSLVRQKTYYLFDRFENPVQSLDYSFEKHKEMINNLRRGVAEVISAKRRLEIQKGKLLDNINAFDEQARRAVRYNKDDIARHMLERKNLTLLQIQRLDKQISGLDTEKNKLQQLEENLAAKIEELRTRIEIIKAQYSAAEAEVRIKESVTGILDEVSDLGIALNKAEEKLEKLKAKSQTLDEMIDSGMLTDYSSNEDKVEKELENITVQKSVEDELMRLKSKRRKKILEGYGQQDQEEEYIAR